MAETLNVWGAFHGVAGHFQTCDPELFYMEHIRTHMSKALAVTWFNITSFQQCIWWVVGCLQAGTLAQPHIG